MKYQETKKTCTKCSTEYPETAAKTFLDDPKQLTKTETLSRYRLLAKNLRELER